jgi:hypothetical protein
MVIMLIWLTIIVVWPQLSLALLTK